MKRFSNRRRGITLVEAIVYISLSSVLITLTGQWFHVLLRTASKNKQRQRQHITLKQLAWEFRNDVWAAKEFSLNDSETALSLTDAAGKKIAYRIGDGQIQKTVGDEKSPTQQETWRDLEDLKIEFEITDETKQVSLNLYRENRLPSSQSPASKTATTANKDDVNSKPILQIRSRPVPENVEREE